jgi:hypothetical protein
MPVSDKSSHVIIRAIRREFREQSRLNGAPSDLFGFGSGAAVGGSAGPLDSTNTGEGEAAAAVADGSSSTGYDFSAWPLESPTYAFDSSDSRFLNMAFFVGVAFKTVMRGLVSEGGHTHDGTNGEGPKLPAASILQPTGAVGTGDTLEDHLRDTTVHAASSLAPGGSSATPAIFDSFDVDDQAARWQVRTGSAVRVADTNGNYRWNLTAGTLVRVKSDNGYAWNDRVAVRFDVLFDSGASERTVEVRFRIRPTAIDYSYDIGASCSRPCWVGELDNAAAVLTKYETGIMPNDSIMRTVECVLNNGELRLDAGAGRRASYTIPREDGWDQGYLELYVPAGAGDVLIDNLFISRPTLAAVVPHAATHLRDAPDELDIADLADAGNFLGSIGASPSHAATHYAGGTQELDVTNLADAAGRLLTGLQRTTLTGGGDASALHTHAGLLTIDHADDPLPGSRLPVAGVSGEAAAADHQHPVPAWAISWYQAFDASTDYVPLYSDFVGFPRSTVRRFYSPTVGGELFLSGYGRGVMLMAELAVDVLADTPVTLRIPACRGNLRVEFEDSGGMATSLYTSVGNQPDLEDTVAILLLGGGVNTIRVYGYSLDTEWNYWLTNDLADGCILNAASGRWYVPV